ncbi:hypothetical protein SteCoe_20435 [Stentor coeruleus]|uniref:Kinesin-like protein n=1 Tax=Stentor coeruleus TaxID=5963 RepID=A0A1R2BRV4_9CILI|nr:hypothetical protein SteCoe_20435 [Stentor coeruleus]
MSRNENIHVSLRFRPLNMREIDENESNIWQVNKNSVVLKQEMAQVFQESKKLTGAPKCYNYNYCFTSKDSNLLVYETVAKRVVRASLDGYNGTIFAYGQTGSGKTYTMMGSEGADHEPLSKPIRKERRSVSPFRQMKPIPKDIPSPRQSKLELPKEKGIIIFALEDLFETVSVSNEKTYYLTCSYLEIYNEQVYDLISETGGFKNEILSVNEDPARGFYVKGLSEHVVGSIAEVLTFIEKGEANRKYAVTSMNHNSSRSHTIFRLNVTSVRVLDAQDEEESSITTESVLNFVDLAGSERVSNLQDTPMFSKPPSNKPPEGRRSSRMRSSNNLDTLLNEGKHINTSLFYLCQVINRLSEKNTAKNDMHIPYRNSNLTKILRSSLGGNSLTCIICTATPTLAQFEMTLSTLRFGGTARTITNRVEANIRNNKNAEILQAYQRDIDVLRQQIQLAQDNGKLKAEEMEAMQKQLEERILKLTHMILNKTSKEHSKQVYENVWSTVSGILNIDKRLIGESIGFRVEEKILKFDSKERMKMMNAIFKDKDKSIQNLTESKQFLIDSKVNLKNELKKAIDLSRQISDKAQKYRQKFDKEKALRKYLDMKLNILEHQEGVEKFPLCKIEALEKFYLQAIDTVKELQVRMNYKQMQEISNISTKNHHKMWAMLGIEPIERTEESSSEEFIQTDASFYAARRNHEDTIDLSIDA